MSQNIYLKTELERLLYDCSKMEDNQAVETCLNKFKSMLRASRPDYITMHFEPKARVNIPVKEEEGVYLKLWGEIEE